MRLAFRTGVRVYRQCISVNLMAEDDWVPAACTLPTVEQPLRRAEFDDLFAHDALSVARESSQQLRLELRADPDVAARAAGLAAKGDGLLLVLYLRAHLGRGKGHPDHLGRVGARVRAGCAC